MLEGCCPALEGDSTALEGDLKALEGCCPALEGDSTALEGHRKALSGCCPALEGDRKALEGCCPALEGDRKALSGCRPALEGDRKALSGCWKALEGDWKALEAHEGRRAPTDHGLAWYGASRRGTAVPMFVGVMRFSIQIVGARSLKDKRSVVRSLKERAQARLRVSIAEVGVLDHPQHAHLGVAVVSNDATVCDQVLADVAHLAGTLPDAMLTDRATEIVPFGDGGRGVQGGIEQALKSEEEDEPWPQ